MLSLTEQRQARKTDGAYLIARLRGARVTPDGQPADARSAALLAQAQADLAAWRAEAP